MCGFLGICDLAGEGLLRVGQLRKHVEPRGRDEWKVHESCHYSVGVARLAIRGGDAGRQPVIARDGRVLAFNGEIYGGLAGSSLSPDASDTEQLAGYLTNIKADKLRNLRGMFAISVWDPQRGCLSLIRDHTGQKPLYWTSRGSKIYFASELQMLQHFVPWPLSCDDTMRAVERVLGWLPAPWTSTAGVYKVPPGSWLKFDAKGIRVKSYWRTPRPEYGDPTLADLPELASELERAVFEQTRARELASFQSGGLDSGLLTVLAHRACSGLRSWSIGVNCASTLTSETQKTDIADTALDLAAAKRLADHLAIPHQGIALRWAEVLSWAERAAPWLDDNYHSISYPLTAALFSNAAVAGLRIGISGEGADELFGGYNYLASGPTGVGTGTSEFLNAYVASRRRFVSSAADPDAEHLAVSLLHESCADILDLPPRIALRHIELRTSLPESLLARVDRLSMRAQIEVRAPYLDHRVVEMALRLGPCEPTDPLRKSLLRRVAAALGAPSDVVAAPKRRFGLGGPLLRQVLDIRQDLNRTASQEAA